MSSIANLLVSLKTDFGSSDSGLSGLISKLVQLGSEAEKTGHKVHDTGVNLEEIGHGAEEGGHGLESLKEIFSDTGAEMISFGAEALALTSIFEALKEAVEVSAQLEVTRVALESLTGSAEKATEVLENMEKVASAEGLSFSELIPAAQHMIALGFSVEQTTEAMKAAGNAAWALGEPIGSVDQRIGMMAQSGHVNARVIRQLGVTMEDLGKIMGVSAGEVTKAFQVISQTDRLEVLIAALQKYGDVGAKEADTVKGKWNELKNSWHEAFGTMGDDVQGLTEALEGFVSFLGKAAGAIAGSLSALNPLKEIKKSVDEATKDPGIKSKTISGLGEDQKLPPSSELNKISVNVVKSTPEKTELQEHAEKALEPLKAKEFAATQLEQIKGAEDANSRLAALDREKTESSIKEEHARRQADIDENEDSIVRARDTAAEEVRVAVERQEKIGVIDAQEARRKSELVKSKIGPEIAKTYTPIPDEGKRSAEIASINQKAKNDLDKISDDLILKQQKASDAVAAAISKQVVSESKITLGQTKTDRDIAGSKLKADAEVEAIGYQEQKIKLESDYEAELTHTYSEQIDHLNAIADLERKGRESNIEGLRSQLQNIPAGVNDDAATKKRADIQNQIAKAVAESSKADAESAEKLTKADVEHLDAIREIDTIKSKSDTDVTSEKLNQQKIKSESDYAELLSHTNEEEIAHLTQIAGIENAQRQVKIQDLQSQLSKTPTGDDPKYLKQRADLAAQIADAQEQANTATLQSAIQITQQMEAQNKLLTAQKELAQALTDWSKIGLGTVADQLTQTVLSLPQQIGNSLAESIFNAPKRGQSKAGEIGEGLVKTTEKAGESLAGKLISSAIEKLIAQLIGQAALDALKNSVTTANSAALVANTAALAANTAAVGVQAGAGAAGAGVQAASTAASTTSAAVSTVAGAATGFISQFGGLIGGLGGGIISGIFSLIGDNKIVRAVNATTAAVDALHGTISTGITTSSTNPLNAAQTNNQTTTGQTTSGASTPSGGFSQGSLLGVIGSIFGFGGTSKPVDVNLVSISPVAPLNGLFKLFGFAGGGDPDPTKPFIAGEHGTEIINPKGQQLTVTPHQETKSILDGFDPSSFKDIADINQHGNTLNRVQPISNSIPHTSTANNTIGELHFHAHDVNNPRQFAEEAIRYIPAVLKARSSQFSPLS